MTQLEKQVARILAVEFVRTGVIDCPRMARLVCRAITPKKGNQERKTKMSNVIARWETRGKDWLELRSNGPSMHPDNKGLSDYFYRGNGCGGGFACKDDAEAVSRMEAPWGDPRGTGQVTVLKTDRYSLRRVK